MRKKILIFVITCLLLLSVLVLTASAATTPIVGTDSGYFLLSLSSTSHLTSTNSAGVGYGIYNDIVQQTTTGDNQFNNWCLQSIIVKYDTSSGTTSYGDYSYVPLSVSEYMSIPEIDGSVYTYPNIALISASDWWQFSFSGPYTHCRAAISIDNYKNLVVLYNSNFFQSYDDFLSHYNAQDIHDKSSFIGLLYLKTLNPDHNDGSYNNGYNHGYTNGYDAGVSESTTPLGVLFSGINSLLNINIFGTFSLGTLIYVFLGLGFLIMVIKVLK